LRGAVRVTIEFDEPRLFEAGREVVLTLGGESRQTEIEALRFQHGRWVLELAGIDSIAEAERWVGGQVVIGEDELPEPEEGSYYDFDLEGCEVVDVGGERLGTVLEVLDYGGTALLRVERGEGEALIPFARRYMKEIDTAGRRIEVALPEGLLDLDTR
jgi:16S rRNA processing protein RimM